MNRFWTKSLQVVNNLPPSDIIILIKDDWDFVKILNETAAEGKEILVFDKILMAENSNVFKKHLERKVESLRVDLPMIDYSAMKLMLHYFKNNSMKFSDMATALKAFNIGVYFESMSFLVKCVIEIDGLLTKENALEAYKELYHFNDVSPIEEGKPVQSFIDYFGRLLLENVYRIIDKNAEEILSMPCIVELRFDQFKLLMKRTSLVLSSERKLFDCLVNWSVTECARKNLKWTTTNAREMLGPLVMLPRLMEMPRTDFEYACKTLGLCEFEEFEILYKAYENERDSKQQISVFKKVFKIKCGKFLRPRTSKIGKPFVLSRRSSPMLLKWTVWSTKKIQKKLCTNFTKQFHCI